MRTLTFLIFLVNSAVHAKTEAAIGLEGFKKKAQSRVVANTVNGLDALTKLGELNQTKPQVQHMGTFFGDSTGALTKRTPANKKLKSKKRLK